ncbi:segregation and condensation protein A [Caldichromatium japonicum]|uniref:Segregation and condensation protein A n=1 Tax=Caldichromatium japonicum TaxID=2699430 RepID=A0A6G7VD42_9GAMM|nr:segregation and condensation protein A [Caldichromatium japonicum]QIK37993.1 segregation and condensation protein A [Caldichromatium japonicum]
MTELTKEQEILIAMRKALTAIIRDVTPQPGMRHPFSDATIEQVRTCLGMIAARERELAEAQGCTAERPYYADESQEVQLVAFDTLKRRAN